MRGKYTLGILLLASFLFSLNFASSAITVELPAENTNHTTTIYFNVSYANETDFTDAQNASFWYNESGTWTLIGKVNCSKVLAGTLLYCNGSLSIVGLTDGLWAINATLNNGTSYEGGSDSGDPFGGASSIPLNITFDSTVPSGNFTAWTNAIANGGVYSNNTNMTINMTATDARLTDVYVNITYLNGSAFNFTKAWTSATNNYTATLNLTGMLRGVYNLTLMINDTANNLNISSITFTVDNTNPGVNTFYNTTNEGSYRRTIGINVSINDSYSSLASVYFNISNSTNHQVNFTKASGSGGYYNISVNTSYFLDGKYNITVWANDTFGFMNSTSKINVSFDNTDPVNTSLTCPSSVNAGQELTCTCFGQDAFSSTITYTPSVTFHPSTTNTGSFTASCMIYDAALNWVNATDTYNVITSEASSSGGGGGTTGTTYSPSEEQLSSGYTKDIKLNERVKFSVGSSTHYAKVTGVTTSKVIVVISSDPVSVELGIGQDAKVDVDKDGTYDVYVKLNGITGGKANLELKKISEIVPAGSESISTNGTVIEGTSGETSETEEGGIGTIGTIIIVILVLAAVAGAGFAVLRRESKIFCEIIK